MNVEATSVSPSAAAAFAIRRHGWYATGVALVVTCARCRQSALGADRIGDEEECLLRDHLLVVHPNTAQPETLTVLLRHFVVTEAPPPAA